MRVLTLDNTAFADACKRLESLVTRDGFDPDLIVEIASGGCYVAASMFESVSHVTATCRRPGSDRKRRLGFFSGVLKQLPRPILDVLRMAEAHMLGIAKHKVVAPEIDSPDAITEANRILVVDDAVDSGVTMKAVVSALSAINPHAEIKAAVITVTTANPLYSPHYTLFNNRTLIRFPWSLDN